MSHSRKIARQAARKHNGPRGILVKIERGSSSKDYYYITVAAGEKVPADIAERGTIVAVGQPEWFRLVRS